MLRGVRSVHKQTADLQYVKNRKIYTVIVYLVYSSKLWNWFEALVWVSEIEIFRLDDRNDFSHQGVQGIYRQKLHFRQR